MKRSAIVLAGLLAMSCSKGSAVHKTAVKLNTSDVAEPVSASSGSPALAPVAVPRIAYTYSVDYAFDRRTVAAVQVRQLALCRALGPARCLVLKSSLSAVEPDEHRATDAAELMVDARLAAELNRRLDALAVAGGATVAMRQVAAEDVTRQVIDTDARVRAKQALADRLLGIVRSGQGKVGELVEAERAYAQTQEELDAARGEQADLAQRVAMSRVTITYAFDDTPGRGSPVRASVASAGETLAASLAALVTFAVAGLPWFVALVVLVTVIRAVRLRFGWRWPRRASPTP